MEANLFLHQRVRVHHTVFIGFELCKNCFLIAHSCIARGKQWARFVLVQRTMPHPSVALGGRCSLALGSLLLFFTFCWPHDLYITELLWSWWSLLWAFSSKVLWDYWAKKIMILDWSLLRWDRPHGRFHVLIDHWWPSSLPDAMWVPVKWTEGSQQDPFMSCIAVLLANEGAGQSLVRLCLGGRQHGDPAGASGEGHEAQGSSYSWRMWVLGGFSTGFPAPSHTFLEARCFLMHTGSNTLAFE
jgi:hypothetical protein